MGVINTKHKNLKLRQNEFLSANPFPYLVIDDFLEKDFFSNLKLVIEENTKSVEGRTFDTVVEKKKMDQFEFVFAREVEASCGRFEFRTMD